jgi:hypothetical protein
MQELAADHGSPAAAGCTAFERPPPTQEFSTQTACCRIAHRSFDV